MTKVMSVARVKIHNGKLQEFKTLAAQCVQLVRAGMRADQMARARS